MKKCCKCKQIKEFSDFYKNKSKKDGLCTECKSCQKMFWKSQRGKDIKRNSAKKYRETNKEKIVEQKRKYYQTFAGTESHQKANKKYCSSDNGREYYRNHAKRQREKFPQRAKARRELGHAVDAGKINRPDTCVFCGKQSFTEGHHKDYSKPLEVDWLCRDCHKNLHQELVLV